MDRWRKYKATDRGSPHWYDLDSFTGLVLSYSALPDPPPLGEFIGGFAGLTRKPTRAAVRQLAGMNDWQLPGTVLRQLPRGWTIVRTGGASAPSRVA